MTRLSTLFPARSSTRALALAFILAAPAAMAIPPLPSPDCTDPDGTEYYRTEAFYGGFVLTAPWSTARDYSVKLVACSQNVALEVSAGGADFDAFVVYEVIDAMVRSPWAYTFDQMAQIFRGQGLTVTNASYGQDPCVCGLQ